MDPIRRAAVAGSWYPGSPATIAVEVDRYLAGVASPAVPGRLVALISPHAGLRYSGPVAANGSGLLRGRSALTVVLIGPSHRAAFDGVALWARGAFETPLGWLPIARDLAAERLAADPAVADNPRAHLQEPSLEMQLPFLQHLVPDLRLVPMLMGRQSRGEVEALAGALARALAGHDVLLVASSDLSHYQPAHEASRLDAVVTDCVARFDPEGLMDRLEAHDNHACGGGPMVAVMKPPRSLGADRAPALRYADSGDGGEKHTTRGAGHPSAALSPAAS